VPIEPLMQVDQENGIQSMNNVTRITHVMDRDFDLLRARVWERSARIARRQRIQEFVLNVVAVVLGSVTGWVVMK
jgi:uncharacterized membrane protein